MDRPRLILIGGGEHARVVADAARAAGTFELLGYVDPRAEAHEALALGLERLGGDEVLARYSDAAVVLAFGALAGWRRRGATVARLTPRVGAWATIVHPTAYVAPGARLGDGTVVCAGAIVQVGVRMGPHGVINTGAIVEHDVILDAHVHVAPGAVLGGGVRVGEGAWIGLGARVRDHVQVGAGAVVGMGAVVVKGVAAYTRVMGVPAR